MGDIDVDAHRATAQGALALVSWTWQRGGTATVAQTDGQQLTVHSSVAYPPGAPLTANTAVGAAYEMKVRSCKRLPSGVFEITGKLVNATRGVREELVMAVQKANAEPPR